MIKITTVTQNYRRSINGAWMSGGQETHVAEVDDAEAPKWLHGFGPSSSRTFEWPDGHREFFYWLTLSIKAGPADSRLRDAPGQPGALWIVN